MTRMKPLAFLFLCLIFFTSFVMAQSLAVSPISPDPASLRFNIVGEPHVTKVTYDKINGEVFAHIMIQLPDPSLSSCGPMCYRISIHKRLVADTASFYPLGETGIATDKDRIFIQGMTHNEPPDNDSAYLGSSGGFRYSAKGEAKDNIPAQAALVRRLLKTDHELFAADAATLQALPSDDNHDIYFKDKNAVYYGYRRLPGADAVSFKLRRAKFPSSEQRLIYTDKSHCYHKGEAISCPGELMEADTREATVVGSNENPETLRWKMIEGSKIQWDTHPRRLDVLGTDYSRDRKQAYFEGKPIKDSDGETFIFFGGYFAKDAKHVYFEDKILPGAKPDETYRVGGRRTSWLTVGEKNVYYREAKTGLDPSTFREEGRYYFADKKRVLHMNVSRVMTTFIELPGADTASFTALDELYAKRGELRYADAYKYGKDKHRVYYKGKPLEGADPETFDFITRNYMRDRNNVYYKGVRVEDADPATFKSVDAYGIRWMDKWNTFQEGKKISAN